MVAKLASLVLVTLVAALACNTSAPTRETLQAEVVSALDTLAAELEAERPTDGAAYAERLRAYLDAHPAFYGSAAALLDHDRRITRQPLRISHRRRLRHLGPCSAILRHRVPRVGHGSIGGRRRRLDGSLF